MNRFFLILLLVWLCPLPVDAQDATHATAARALFGEGVAAADAEDWATAAERFQQALRLRSSPTIALNLAIALGHLGRVVEAAELLRGAIRAPDANDEVRSSARQTLSELEPQVAWARLTVDGPLEGISLEADGHPLSTELVGSSVPLDPGTHRLVALRGGEAVATIELTLAAGARQDAHLVVPEVVVPEVVVPDVVPEVVVPEVVPEVPDLSVPIDPPSSGPDPLALGLGIGGGVLVVGGVVALVLVFVLPTEASPFVGNAGVIEVGR